MNPTRFNRVIFDISNKIIIMIKYFGGKYFKLIFIFLLVVFILSSCVTHKELEYIQDSNKNIKSFNISNIQDYKLKPNDELYIQISSLDENTTNIFGGNTNGMMLSAGMQPYGASLMSYAINKEGYIQLPVIGSILVKDKTVVEVSQIIKDSLNRILNQPSVTVKLVNRYVSVIGEVKLPGHFSYSQEKLSILDAIGLAGDLTDYGDRHQVILIREENGKNLRINLDLTESDFLSSDYYFVKPNDIVYIKPLRKKFWGFNQFPFAILLSAVTTGILVINYVK